MSGRQIMLLGVVLAFASGACSGLHPLGRRRRVGLFSNAGTGTTGSQARPGHVGYGLVAAETVPGTVDVKIAVDAPMLLVTTTRQDQCAFDVVDILQGPNGQRTNFPFRRVWRACLAVAPHTPVLLTLPGDILEIVTDERGVAAIVFTRLPSTSAITATVIVPAAPVVVDEPPPMQAAPMQAPPMQAPPLRPSAPPAPARKGLSLVRDTLISCGKQRGERGLVKVTLTLGANAYVQAVRVDRSTLQACVRNTLVGQTLAISQPAGDLLFPYVIQ